MIIDLLVQITAITMLLFLNGAILYSCLVYYKYKKSLKKEVKAKEFIYKVPTSGTYQVSFEGVTGSFKLDDKTTYNIQVSSDHKVLFVYQDSPAKIKEKSKDQDFYTIKWPQPSNGSSAAGRITVGDQTTRITEVKPEITSLTPLTNPQFYEFGSWHRSGKYMIITLNMGLSINTYYYPKGFSYVLTNEKVLKRDIYGNVIKVEVDGWSDSIPLPIIAANDLIVCHYENDFKTKIMDTHGIMHKGVVTIPVTKSLYRVNLIIKVVNPCNKFIHIKTPQAYTSSRPLPLGNKDEIKYYNTELLGLGAGNIVFFEVDPGVEYNILSFELRG
jgi:hypothetical protein